MFQGENIFGIERSKWIKENKYYFAGFILILLVFTFVKAPFMDEPLTSPSHSTKYRTLISPPFEMERRNDPLVGEIKYPISLEEAQSPSNNEFRMIPLYSWGLYSFFEIFPGNEIDLNARIFTNALGIVTLVLIFIYLSKVFNEKFSILTSAIIAVSFLFNFAHFVTVWDSMMILFMFASLILLEKFFKSGDVGHLFIAGILGGVGVNQKYSLFLILAPFSVIMLYFESSDRVDFLSWSGFLLSVFLVPETVHQLSISVLPINPLRGVLVFLLLVGIMYVLYLKSNYVLMILKRIFRILLDRPVYLMPLIALVLTASHFFLKFSGLYEYTVGFLTDSSLLFNWEMYFYMGFNQIIPTLTLPIFALGLFGILSFPVWEFPKKWRNVVLAFLGGAVFYWILASKSIFFHFYYLLIFLFLFSISAAAVVYAGFRRIEINSLGALLVVVLVFGLIFPFNWMLMRRDFRGGPELEEPADYLFKNTSPEEKFIALDINSTLLTFYTGRKSVSQKIVSENIRREVRENGFGQAMNRYDVKYVVASCDLDYTLFHTAITDNYVNNRPRGSQRSRLIREVLGQSEPIDNKTGYEKSELIKRFGIKDSISLENQIGRFKFFRISD
ncbi:MAG: glycosyltransferase family 39 protein [Promethearchaeia archaeon]